ncbi:MAG: RpiB/LacA/LacB family sugar-phosphate isomerase [Candidatus Levybacteria bacterium]|nr:RpiB/LacA/LacB family sugar-phosphate isomerase [Candidatus Levybacteria bacterium]
MTIFLGADHRGFELKNKIKSYLLNSGFEVRDLGANEFVEMDDFVEYAVSVGQKVSETLDSKGIVICGSGAGVEIAANKVKAVRCSLGQSAQQIKKAREDDDINVLAIASDFTDIERAKDLIESFLKTDFVPNENHVRRIEKIKALE